MASDNLVLDQFLSIFHASEKPRSKHMVGIELEYIGFFKGGRKRLSFDALQEILRFFMKDGGFEPHYEAGGLVELHKGLSVVSLEPGMQLEFGSDIRKSLVEIESDVLRFQEKLHNISDSIGAYWVMAGYDPFSAIDEIPWVPKQRYATMRKYLSQFGPEVLKMMAGTAGCQLNVDYSDMADMAMKMRVANAAAMIFAAVFANSCMSEGRVTSMPSLRSQIWNHVDPARSGYVPPSLKDDFSYRDYAEYIAKVPMLVVERGGEVKDVAGVSFSDFVAHGAKGITPQEGDWKTQLSAAFPFARLRNTIETRTTDSGPLSHVMAMAAFWKGLFYSEKALEKSYLHLRGYSARMLDDLKLQVPSKGLGTQAEGRKVTDEAAVLLEMAAEGLRGQGLGEVKYLKYAQDLVSSGKSLSEKIIQGHQEGSEIEIDLRNNGLIFE